MPDPSDEILDAVSRDADRYYCGAIEAEAKIYERGHLASLGVRVPPHTLHDYSLSATRIIVEAIKLRAEERARFFKRHGYTPMGAMYQLAPIMGALQVERERLASLERKAA